jgi:hypothetical protein
MAKLLRLHLTSVGHKDARFFPLTLDFRARDGAATDNVVWLRNGGGKSSLLNLFFSTFLPESRKFLGSKADRRERKLTDYVKAGDLAVVVSEWEMPRGVNLFAPTRIVGQALAWRGGVATPEHEERLDREFFTFRGSDKFPFQALPIYGLGSEPKKSMKELREWLGSLETHRELEVERGTEGKGNWRAKLNAVGVDTELFNYQLTMNGREGGAAELFKVRDTMEFVDLFLEMALHPEQCEKTANQIEGVRTSLMKLPQHELEDRFITALLGELRPLAHEAEAMRNAEIELREQRKRNGLLRAAIDHSIELRQTQLTAAGGELEHLTKAKDKARAEKLAKQEHRLNYDYVFRELSWEEAKTSQAACFETLATAKRQEQIAEAAIRFAAIAADEGELRELRRSHETMLAEQKPVVAELHDFGATFAAALDTRLGEVRSVLQAAKREFSRLCGEHAAADGRLKIALQARAAAETQVNALKQRLSQRDQRRAELLNDNLVQPKEKAAEALPRWAGEEAALKQEVTSLDARINAIDVELGDIPTRESTLALKRQKREAEATERHESWKRGSSIVAELSANRHIREVLTTDEPDLDFPELPSLLRARASKLLDTILDARLEGVDDERILRAVEADRLFPPARDIEVVLAHLASRGIHTAMPAYRFLATNVPDAETASRLLHSDPARFSGVVITKPEEFAKLRDDGLRIAGLRHPVAVTLSALPEHENGTSEVAVALPESAAAYHYDAAATEQSAIQKRIGDLAKCLQQLETMRQETADTTGELEKYRREFSRTRLEQLGAERDNLREEVARLAQQLTGLHAQQATCMDAKSAAKTQSDELRAGLPRFTTAQERLRNFLRDYEEPGEEWIAERDQKLVQIEELMRKEGDEKRALERLVTEIEPARVQVSRHEQDHDALVSKRAAIEFEADEVRETLALSAAEARYETSLALFKEKFGQDKLSGQLEAKSEYLEKLRTEHTRKSAGLEADEISVAALHPDLEGRQQEVKRAHLAAHSAAEAAKHQVQITQSERRSPPAHKQGRGLPAGAVSPTTAVEAGERRAECDAEIEQWKEAEESLGGRVNAAAMEKQRIESSIIARKPLLTTLDGLTDSSTGPMPALSDDEPAVAALVEVAKNTTADLANQHEAANEAANSSVQRLLGIGRRTEFTTIAATATEKLAALPQPELLQRCGELIQGYEARQKAVRFEVAIFAKDKDIAVRALDGVATSALRVLGQADRASTMPDSFLGWVGLPFLRITAHPIAEPAARRDRLAALVDRMVSEKAVPRGHELAAQAVREVGGLIRATLLKPEDPLRPDRHDITEFSTFSDGEKMTAAILLYVTLAQLRARGRHQQGREREAGVLILDNPFGTASKREFVELQLRVARQMDVQLIYTTGVNDLGALDVLPRILRLRKRHRDRRTGDLLLSQELPEEHVEAVQANLRS